MINLQSSRNEIITFFVHDPPNVFGKVNDMHFVTMNYKVKKRIQKNWKK